VSPRTWATAAVLAVGVALVIGLPPAWRARRLRIVDALAGR
jgi:putative ABC transport system permease protein